ncbi:hypothetical protein [Burkholderia sp. AW49-1]
MMNLLEAMRIFGAASNLKLGDAQATDRIDACATVHDSPVGGFQPLETIRRVDGASATPSTPSTPLHGSSR